MESVAAWGHLLWLALAVVAYFAGRKLIEQAARGIVDERLETLKAGFAEDLEQKRAGFTAQIERQKAEAAGELEEKKSELGKLSTVIQHNLQQEIIRSELRIRSLHKVYPVLSKKFHDALGAANHAITPMSIGGPDYDKLSEKELAALLEQYRLGDHDRRELQDEMASGRGRGQIFFKLDRRKRFAEAFNARTRAHNYMLVKRLYLSDEVLALAKKVDQGLVSPLVEAQMFYEYGPNRNAKKNELNNAQDETNALGEVLEQLDKQMRSELTPRPVG